MKCKCSVFTIERAVRLAKSSAYRDAILSQSRLNTRDFTGYTERSFKYSQDKPKRQCVIYISFSQKQDINHVTNLK
jgi:hypothetical protein